MRVGVAICSSIWLACLAVSSPYWIFAPLCRWKANRRHCDTASQTPWYICFRVRWLERLKQDPNQLRYWIFGSTVERPRRPSAMLASTGSDVITRSGNATAHAPEAFTETVLDLLQRLSISERNRDLDFGPDNDDVLDFSDYDLGDDLEPERSRASLAPVKMMCKLDWPSVSYRKTWTYAFLVLDQSAPCVLEPSLSHYYRLVRVPRAGSVRATRRHRHLQRSARLSHARAQPQQAEGRCSAHAQTYRRRQDGPGGGDHIRRLSAAVPRHRNHLVAGRRCKQRSL